jgi:hypothetical protein
VRGVVDLFALAYRDLGDARQAITDDEQRSAIAREIGDRRIGIAGLVIAFIAGIKVSERPAERTSFYGRFLEQGH